MYILFFYIKYVSKNYYYIIQNNILKGDMVMMAIEAMWYGEDEYVEEQLKRYK